MKTSLRQTFFSKSPVIDYCVLRNLLFELADEILFRMIEYVEDVAAQFGCTVS